MAFRRLVIAVLLVACGVTIQAAWQHGFWATLTGAILVALWLAAIAARAPASGIGALAQPSALEADDAVANRLLLDAAPTPMLAIEAGSARALNRAARQVFATDDRVSSPPTGLLDPAARHVAYEGRHWRVDRVVLAGQQPARMIAALVDVEQEERLAEARATAEMIHVLGQELLNGLAPIVSLADSGLAALERPDPDIDLLREIMGTLARRVEGLQRFTEAYRALARLPEPVRRPVAPAEVATDLARLFAGRWPQVALTLEVADAPVWSFDRDQISQATWALLQNGAEAAIAACAVEAAVALAIRSTDSGLAIEVSDNGAGVPLDAAARIFRPFHTTKPDGSGIGLSLARQIAHAHGGLLTIESVSPVRFRLTLPAA